jgi:hypothetical protein
MGIRVGVKGNSRDRETPLGPTGYRPAAAPRSLGARAVGPTRQSASSDGACGTRTRPASLGLAVGGDPSPRAPRENRVPLFTRSPLQKLGITSLLPN